MYRICFTVGGKTYCIEIPVLLWRWPWPGPDPDPWKRVGDWVSTGPTPNPWAVNLPILATVATLAEHAKGDLKGRLQEVVKAQTAEIQKQLPQGTKLQFGAQQRRVQSK